MYIYSIDTISYYSQNNAFRSDKALLSPRGQTRIGTLGSVPVTVRHSPQSWYKHNNSKSGFALTTYLLKPFNLEREEENAKKLLRSLTQRK